MKRILLLPNQTKDKDLMVSKAVIKRLYTQGAEVWVNSDSAELTEYGAHLCHELPTDVDVCIVMGGDGTILDAAPWAVDNGIPLLGINLGRLGFLSSVDPSEIALLDKLFDKDIISSERMLLALTVETSGGKRKTANRYALNDIVVSKAENTAISDIKVSDAKNNDINYRADGIIFATPSGSSAYSLSAGGPLIDADVEAICVTPICCHSFFNRSLIFDAKNIIRVENTSQKNEDLIVSLDGRMVDRLMPKDIAIICVAPTRLKMLSLSAGGMLSTLRHKIETTEFK